VYLLIILALVAVFIIICASCRSEKKKDELINKDDLRERHEKLRDRDERQ